MKRLRYIKGLLSAGTAIAALSLLTGCTKELNQTPQSSANNSAIFGSTQGLALYANSFYDNLASASTIVRGDDQYGDADYGVRTSNPTYLVDGSVSSETVGSWSFTALRNINYFIANVSIPNANISTTVQQNYIGLARFFRAYFYYNMVVQYGNVPWIGHTLSTTDTLLYSAQTDRDVVIDSVIADLKFATQNITLTSDATASQITKWVAYGLLSRVCLFEGTYQFYQNNDSKGIAAGLLTQAAAAAKAVMDSSGNSLNKTGGSGVDYRNLFISTAAVTPEVMLSDVMSTSLAVLNDANWYYTSSTYGSRYSFTRDFINMYLNADGTPFTNNASYPTMGFYDETQNRDPRLAQTIRTPGYHRTSSGVSVDAPPSFGYSLTGYQPIKWCLDDTYYDGGAYNNNSICLMRYAEILLNYAEAVQELSVHFGGAALSASDWTNTIGALRTRAGITGNLTEPTTADPYLVSYFNPTMPTTPTPSGITLPVAVTDPVLLEIRRERSIELVLEGFRFADLSRWKLGVLLELPWKGMYVPAVNTDIDLDGDGTPDVNFYNTTSAPGKESTVTYVSVGTGASMQLSNGTSGQLQWLDNGIAPRDWHDYKYLYPISYSQILLDPQLVQNAGWQ